MWSTRSLHCLLCSQPDNDSKVPISTHSVSVSPNRVFHELPQSTSLYRCVPRWDHLKQLHELPTGIGPVSHPYQGCIFPLYYRSLLRLEPSLRFDINNSILLLGPNVAKYSKLYLINELLSAYQSTGKIPNSKQFHIHENVYRYHFGSWSAALTAAEIISPTHTKRCKHCDNELPTKKYATTFCNQSCAAKHNNQQRAVNRPLCVVCDGPVKHSNNECCSASCRDIHYATTVVDPRVKAGEVNSRSTLRKYLIRHNGRACNECNLSEWRGVSLPLEVDHINGDASNNFPSNLRLLCPNCHSLTPTWKGRNKGSGRKARGLHTN